jgi:hypothetical protein
MVQMVRDLDFLRDDEGAPLAYDDVRHGFLPTDETYTLLNTSHHLDSPVLPGLNQSRRRKSNFLSLRRGKTSSVPVSFPIQSLSSDG